MDSGDQSKEFLVLLDGEITEYAQAFGKISYDSHITQKYAATVLDDGGFVQVAMNAEQLQNQLSAGFNDIAKNRHLKSEGYLFIIDRQGRVVSAPEKKSRYIGKPIAEVLGSGRKSLPVEDVLSRDTIAGEKAFAMYRTVGGYYVCAVLPESEAMHDRDVNFYLNSLLQIMVYALLYGMVYFMISRLVIKNLNKVNKSLEMITDGDLDTKVNVKATTEFTELSEHINITVDALKKHIEMEKKRMAEELEFARRIQTSALPGVFPPFPNCQAIDIFASMDAAKEVGGDFYDFFWVTKNKIAIIIADVSGKGIPAAMFMMTAKTMINNMVMTQAAVNEVMKSVNNKLCESNDAGMFVTCWMAVIDISTGHVEFANAGHNPPLLCHPDGDFEFIKGRSGLVLAGMEGVPYRMGEFDIEPGSMIYLYTDGVTEATDSENRLYGEDRLLKCLNSNKNIDASRLCEAVKKDVDDFVGDAPQFDDITMLAFGFKGFVEEWNDNYLNQNKTV